MSDALAALDRYSRRLGRYKGYAPREYTDDSFEDYCILRAALEGKNTREYEARILVRRLARRLPKDDPFRLQAEDYLRRTFSAADVLREDEVVGKP